MKAFVFERTGDPNDVLAVRELPKAARATSSTTLGRVIITGAEARTLARNSDKHRAGGGLLRFIQSK
jgi:hypothetical protein